MMWETFTALVIAGLAYGFVDSNLGMDYGVTSAAGIIELQSVAKLWSP